MYIDPQCAKRTLRTKVIICGASVCFAPLAFGQPRVEMRPVNNGLYRATDAPVIPGAVITGNKISLTGGGVNVEMELLASDWGTSICPNGGNPGTCTLGACQGTIDSTGYLGLNASPAQSGVDLNPLGNDLTPTPAERARGAFIAQSACSTSLRDCTSGQPPCAGPEGFCVPNDRWVSACLSCTLTLGLITLNYEYSAISGTSQGVPNVPASDAQNNGYFGSLILEVPAAAVTTYTIGFVDDINYSFFNDDVGLLIPNPLLNPNQTGPFLIPGQIQIVTGACCTNLGDAPSGGICTGNVTQAQCNSLPTTNTRVFQAGQSCGEFTCCINCTNDSQCSDGNVCTTDNCHLGCYCESLPAYDVQAECCNPNGGATIPLSDNNACTTDACNPATGQVTHTPVGSGPCEDGNSCTLNDVCIGATCIGSTASTVPCSSDADCTPAFCNLSTGFCGCSDLCPTDPDKNFPGVCGCGVPDVGDGDGDGTLDCVDACPADPTKSAPGVCGCGVPDVGDADADGTLDCVDVCPTLDDDIFAPDCVPPIPTVSGWGLVVVALLLLIGGKLGFPQTREITVR